MVICNSYVTNYQRVTINNMSLKMDKNRGFNAIHCNVGRGTDEKKTIGWNGVLGFNFQIFSDTQMTKFNAFHKGFLDN